MSIVAGFKFIHLCEVSRRVTDVLLIYDFLNNSIQCCDLLV